MMDFRTGYMDVALFSLSDVIENACRDLSGTDFDTLVGTGFSGGVVVPALALAMNKNFVLVRKPNDDSHHSGKLIGVMGERWLFVDDFECSGATKRRVIEQINEATAAVKDQAERMYNLSKQMGWERTEPVPEEPEYLGDYMYRERGLYLASEQVEPI